MDSQYDLVEPAAIVQAHLEGGGHGEQPPAPVQFRKYPQTAGPRNIVGIARDGKELVEGRVADGELSAEHPVHPGCGA